MSCNTIYYKAVDMNLTQKIVLIVAAFVLTVSHSNASGWYSSYALYTPLDLSLVSPEYLYGLMAQDVDDVEEDTYEAYNNRDSSDAEITSSDSFYLDERPTIEVIVIDKGFYE